ncbi:scavenger receptor cysteine-rich domain-containing group B protein-like [Lingula anatina]|uniref:Scavenger receptor cysteine-rich domain-containing group B protein-like n=1 Tax=Lingula anatina TaxID=7574 RepID=A0A1S3JS02_LINAN|nr:scavenger receptor cysteine-rich domain-containing group B protein-like [Lingula anatina]|eukprot:XP_013413097.1 scavenger receptor cysteine-rich domain-containing group B protein-like [Lingula anatina]
MVEDGGGFVATGLVDHDPRGTGAFWLSDVNCAGTEAALYNCSSGGWDTISSVCGNNNYDDAGVICKAQGDGELRLVNTSNAYEGSLEIQYGGRWGRVCGYGWDLTSANVACKQLGFTGAHTPISNMSTRGTGRYWIQNLNCQGSEASLSDCYHDGVGGISSQYCDETLSHDAGVLCRGPNDGDVRLVGPTQYMGRVEIFYAGNWGRVCTNGWSLSDAVVTCRQLGFSGAVGSFTSLTPRGTSRVLLGSLEIQYGGRWGRVCGYGWDLTSANVACKQLGFTGAHTPISNMSTRGTGRYWIQNLNCQGSEASLSDCYHDGVGGISSQYCDETLSHDAGVLCRGPNDGDVRLVGPTQYMGRVEIFYAGNWGRVCTNGWSLSDAVVTCRQLGFSGAVGSFTSLTPRGTSRTN